MCKEHRELMQRLMSFAKRDPDTGEMCIEVYSPRAQRTTYQLVSADFETLLEDITQLLEDEGEVP